MVDVLIKDVPEGAENDVRNLAMVAVERFLNMKTKVVDTVKEKALQDQVDLIRLNNNVEAKFTVLKAEPIEEPIKEELK